MRIDLHLRRYLGSCERDVGRCFVVASFGGVVHGPWRLVPKAELELELNKNFRLIFTLGKAFKKKKKDKT